MDMNQVVYWYKDQVVITFYDIPARDDINNRVSLYQSYLNDHLLKGTRFRLERLGNDDLYVFPSDASSSRNDIAVFYKIERRDSEAMADTADYTLDVIDHLHTDMAILQTGFSVMPHWFWAGTPDGTHGCPVSPPIPVEDSGTRGQWKIFPLLSDPSLEEKTGEGVTVFVLDTLPPYEQISGLEKTDSNNVLLQKMLTGMVSKAPFDAVPPAINVNYLDSSGSPLVRMASGDMNAPDSPEMVVTGKDIYGRLVGFSMPDHGLAVAGIVRDLAPEANIECIRVLGDFGVGDLSTLYKAFDYIQKRMSHKGNLYEKPVVINLSLVVVPPKSDWSRFRWDKHPNKLMRSLEGLSRRMHSLSSAGAVFAASAGNDSDPRDTNMNPLEVRFGPRYPAAFLYDNPPVTTMIPIGAVNRKGKATVYSNYPGEGGIATFGGDLPRPDPWLPSAMLHLNARVDTSEIDALCGLYRAAQYPALSKNDSEPEYPAPNSSAWAYWSGTSFATPIISAMAARVLQGRQPKSVDVRKAIIAAAGQQTVLWTGLESDGDASGSMIMAFQAWQPDNAAS